jgi:hypothetical protein
MKRMSDYFNKTTCKRRLTEDVSYNSSDSTTDLSGGFPNATVKRRVQIQSLQLIKTVGLAAGP